MPANQSVDVHGEKVIPTVWYSFSYDVDLLYASSEAFLDSCASTNCSYLRQVVPVEDI